MSHPELTKADVGEMTGADWSTYGDMANVVTAVSAVAGVVVAAYLGLKGVKVAQEGNARTSQELLLSEAHALMADFFRLQRAATSSGNQVSVDEVELAGISLDGRVEAAAALGLISRDSEHRNELHQMVYVIRKAVTIRNGISDGSIRLADYVFDESGDEGDLLAQWDARLHSQVGYESDPKSDDSYIFIPGFDGLGVCDSFNASPAAAERLRVAADSGGRQVTGHDALRLVLPLLYERFGTLQILRDVVEDVGVWAYPDPDPSLAPDERVERLLNRWMAHNERGYRENPYEKCDVESPSPVRLLDQFIDDALGAAQSALRSMIREAGYWAQIPSVQNGEWR